MGYILYVSQFTVVIFSGNIHGALLQVKIQLLTIFVVKSSHNLVIYRNLCIFMVLALLETPHNHCITIVRMISNKVYFNLKNRFVGCSRFINLCSIWSSSGLCAFINHSHLLHYYHHNFQMREKDKLCRNFFIKIK